MSELAKELEDDIQKEKLELFWDRYKYLVIVLILFFLALVAYVSWNKTAIESHKEYIGSQYLKALDLSEKKNYEASNEMINQLLSNKKTNNKNRALLELTKASNEKNMDNIPAAIDTLNNLGSADTQSYNRIALIAMAFNSSDENSEELSSITSKLATVTNSAPLHWNNKLLRTKAVIHLKKENKIEAQAIYDQLMRDESVSGLLKEVATAMEYSLGGGVPAEIRKIEQESKIEPVTN